MTFVLVRLKSQSSQVFVDDWMRLLPERTVLSDLPFIRWTENYRKTDSCGKKHLSQLIFKSSLLPV
jgi:monomeric isocitrate dehydrogenase